MILKKGLERLTSRSFFTARALPGTLARSLDSKATGFRGARSQGVPSSKAFIFTQQRDGFCSRQRDAAHVRLDLARQKRSRQRRQWRRFNEIPFVAPAEEGRRLQVDPTKRTKTLITSIRDPAQGLFKFPNGSFCLSR